MVTPIPLDELAIVGGNLALDFANTQSGPPFGEPDVEALGDYGDLVAWAVRAAALAPGDADELVQRADRQPRDAEAAFEHATAIRARIYEAFAAVAAGDPPPAGALAVLRDEAASALAHADLVPAGGAFAWTWSGSADLDLPVRPVVHAAVTLLTDGPLGRVKGCGGCRYLFLDETKNGSRRWCRMAECGTRAKSRRFVARRSAARSGTGSTDR